MTVGGHALWAEDDQLARLDPGRDPAPQPGGLHQLGRHHPARRLLEQRRAGEDGELGAARAEVFRLHLAKRKVDFADQEILQLVVDAQRGTPPPATPALRRC